MMRRSLIALLLPALGLGGCWRKPTVSLGGIEVTGFDLRKLDLLLHLKVTNPNAGALHMDDLTYGLSAGGIEIAKGAAARPIPPLAGRSDTIVPAPVSIDFLNLAPVLNQSRGAESIPFDFAGTATFKVLGWEVPVRLRRIGEIPPLKEIGWRFVDVDFQAGRPSWLALKFEVDNPNRFELPLSRLRGALKYGDDILLRVDEPKLQPVPAGGRGEFTVKVRLDGVGVTTAVARAVRDRRSKRFRFDGQLRFGVPEMLRALARDPKDRPRGR